MLKKLLSSACEELLYNGSAPVNSSYIPDTYALKSAYENENAVSSQMRSGDPLLIP